ncbi:MAG: chemotaxis protein CheB, partial [Phycisphaerales bacterium]
MTDPRGDSTPQPPEHAHGQIVEPSGTPANAAKAPAGDGGSAMDGEPCYLVCLGASAGGLETLESFFTSVPANTGAAFVIVSHLSPDFKSLMPELLSRHTKMKVRTAEEGLAPEPNTISIIPPGKNMVFRGGCLRLESQDRSSGHILQLPIDIFLHSVSIERPHRTVAIILSGTGSDGSRGIKALKAGGGIVLAQSPETARFDGMPRAAIDTGIVDASGSPNELSNFVMDLIRKGALTDLPGDDDVGASEVLPVIEAMRAQFQQDVSYLRPSMLRRRVRRRMALLNVPSIAAYAERIVDDAAEARALKQDTLIGVTSFFRDSDAFRYLQRHLAGTALRTPSTDPFRVWVPACSSGEEVYSLAIIIREALEANGVDRDVKIFATDVDEDSLARASRATYPISIAEDLGPARIEKYFTGHGDTFTVKTSLREMVIFAHHNLVRDPPFTKIDLASCRNFLIYLTPTAQESVLSSLHFSLNRNGTLFLGSAEALGRLEGEFETVDTRFKVFTKSRYTILPSMRLRAGLQDPMVSAARPLILSTRDRDRDTLNRQVLETLVDRAERSVAVLTTEGGLLDIVSDAAHVFRVPKGRVTSDIARMLADPLVVAVTTGLQRLRRGDERDATFAVALAGEPPRRMTARLTHLPAVGNEKDRVLLVVESARDEGHTISFDTSALDQATAERMGELQTELLQTRESLQATIEELQSANEEQQSTNEELIASNEELQSTNEELQSVNEELFTVNVEYQNKIQELAVVAADLNNLLRNIDISILFLDDDLRVRKFTPAIDQIVKLVDHDVGRSIEHFAHTLGPEFVASARRVIETGRPHEEEARSITGAWLMVRIMPYVTHTGRTGGVVATFVDITAIKNANEMTRVA